MAALLGAGSPHIELLVDAIFGTLIMKAAVLENFTDPATYADQILAIIDQLRGAHDDDQSPAA